jgi:hypothetical protein
MIAAGSLGAAAHGLLKSSSHKLLEELLFSHDIKAIGILDPQDF